MIEKHRSATLQLPPAWLAIDRRPAAGVRWTDRESLRLTAHGGALATTRRDAILNSLAAAIAAAGSAGFPASLFAQAEVTAEQFLQLSERLTGAGDLDQDVARILLGGFLATGHGPELLSIATAGQSSPSPLCDAIVAAWYSGLYDTGHGTAVSDFNGALVWNALSFTKPFGSCGGAVGYWADPPET